MKILAFSDTHGLMPALDLEGIDLIGIAGDVCPATNHSPDFQRRWLEEVFCPWTESMRLPVYLTLGNHDFVDDFPAPPNLHYGTATVVDGILLFSWTPTFFDWAWIADEEGIARRLDEALVNSAPSIWVTHGPPHGVCDEVGRRHCGSLALHDAILRRKPELIICGHLHEGSPEGWLGDSNIRNVSFFPDGKRYIDHRRGRSHILSVSLLNDSYRPFRQPVIIEVPERAIL